MERLYREETRLPGGEEEVVVEIQERMVLLEITRSSIDGRILSRRILRFLTPEEEDDLLRRIAVRLQAGDV